MDQNKFILIFYMIKDNLLEFISSKDLIQGLMYTNIKMFFSVKLFIHKKYELEYYKLICRQWDSNPLLKYQFGSLHTPKTLTKLLLAETIPAIQNSSISYDKTNKLNGFFNQYDINIRKILCKLFPLIHKSMPKKIYKYISNYKLINNDKNCGYALEDSIIFTSFCPSCETNDWRDWNGTRSPESLYFSITPLYILLLQFAPSLLNLFLADNIVSTPYERILDIPTISSINTECDTGAENLNGIIIQMHSYDELLPEESDFAGSPTLRAILNNWIPDFYEKLETANISLMDSYCEFVKFYHFVMRGNKNLSELDYEKKYCELFTNFELLYDIMAICPYYFRNDGNSHDGIYDNEFFNTIFKCNTKGNFYNKTFIWRS